MSFVSEFGEQKVCGTGSAHARTGKGAHVCILSRISAPTADRVHALQGFPALVHAMVTYTLTADNKLEAVMEARSFGATPINMAQHSYFNLDGSASGTTVLDHVVEMPNACAPQSIMSGTLLAVIDVHI